MKWVFLILMPLLLSADASFGQASPDVDGYTLVFSDDFNLPNGSQPDSLKWRRHNRNMSTWARWISPSPKVVTLKNGAWVCRAIPNHYEPQDTARMLTGAISTMQTFHFTYGKVEVRMKTNVKNGNFPAAWLQGLQKKKPEWYKEIDIV